jgi:ABC-type nitrate/sulfonate/bicarbonate transport system substrate-binding protein
MNRIHRSHKLISKPIFVKSPGALASALLMARHVPKVRVSRQPKSRRAHPARRDGLTIGFVPMIDCAVLIAAKELGLFGKHGLDVTLSREVGWATIREKLLHDELHAVHAPASMGFVVRCGIGIVPRPCLTAFVLSLNGSAITLSRELWERGVRDAATLREVIEADRGGRTYSFGAVLEFATQNYNLRRWLRGGGIDPDRDVRIPIIPSPVIHRGLLDGHLDGYSVAEPWNSIAVDAGAGWIAATSAEIAPGQPEKVLLVLEEFAEQQPDEHLAMVAALVEASIFCELPANRPALARMLSHSRYLDVPASLIGKSLIGPLETGHGSADVDDLITYHRGGANVPDRAKGRRVFNEVRAQSAAQQCRALRPDVIGRIFREDLYHRAVALTGPRESAPAGPHSRRVESNASSAPPFLPRIALAG